MEVQNVVIGPPVVRFECTVKVMANGKLVQYKPDDCARFIRRYIEQEVKVRVLD